MLLEIICTIWGDAFLRFAAFFLIFLAGVSLYERMQPPIGVKKPEDLKKKEPPTAR